MPTMGMDVASNQLNLQSDLKAAELDALCCSEFVNTEKTWSSNPTAPDLVSFGEGLVSAEYHRAHDKSDRRVGVARFEVRFDPPGDANLAHHDHVDNDPGDDAIKSAEFKGVPIPLFARVRIVTIDANKVMYCSCEKFEGRGHFCADQICVANSVYRAAGLTFAGFTKSDVALRYTTAFMHLGYKKTTPNKITALFHELASNEVKGPTLPLDIPHSLPIEEASTTESALDRLKNYDKTKIDLSRVDNMHCFTHTPADAEIVGGDELEDELEVIFSEMMSELQESTPQDFSAVFNESVLDSDVPPAGGKRVGARTNLRSLVNTAYDLADRLGDDGSSRLEQVVSEFNSWCSSKLAVQDQDSNDKRKYVCLSQQSYEGTAKRVFNTRHM